MVFCRKEFNFNGSLLENVMEEKIHFGDKCFYL